MHGGLFEFSLVSLASVPLTVFFFESTTTHTYIFKFVRTSENESGSPQVVLVGCRRPPPRYLLVKGVLQLAGLAGVPREALAQASLCVAKATRAALRVFGLT